MKKPLKKLIPIVLSAVTALSVALCGCGSGRTGGGGEHSDRIEYTAYDASTVAFNANSDKELANYDKSLYYINEWDLGYSAPGAKADYFPDMADPIIIFDEGYYYAFGTRQTTVYQCFRSKDLTTWERLADAFVPSGDSWGKNGLYAPDIQKIGDKWYLYYTANCYWDDEPYHSQLGVAVADRVYGPYTQFTGVNANGENISVSEPAFRGMAKHQILDANVLVDGDELYMYFSYDTKTPKNSTSEYSQMSKDRFAAEIWGVRLKDPVTWDLSTLTPLVTPGYKTYDAPKRTVNWEVQSVVEGPGYGILEGPYAIKKDGKYILTYSANLYTHDCYSVGYAVADSPLGRYVKPDDEYMQNMILGVPDIPGTGIANNYVGFTKGTGHAGIFQAESGEYMFAYHAHFNRLAWNDTPPNNYRALAIDYIYFDENGLPYTNGPTYSLQPKPSSISGYTNLAKSAKIRVEGENAQYLNDDYTNRACGIRANGKNETPREANFKAGTRSIELAFYAPVTVKAVNVYNSFDYERAVEKIDQIDFGNGKGITDILFNRRYFSQNRDEFIFPHAAFNIELGEEITTDRIVITITNAADFSLGEIQVIGKNP